MGKSSTVLFKFYDLLSNAAPYTHTLSYTPTYSDPPLRHTHTHAHKPRILTAVRTRIVMSNVENIERRRVIWAWRNEQRDGKVRQRARIESVRLDDTRERLSVIIFDRDGKKYHRVFTA